jgi:hypothetical protein
MKKCNISDGDLRETRNNTSNVCINDPFVPKCSLMLSNQTPKYLTPRIFNALSQQIKLIECDNSHVLYYYYYNMIARIFNHLPLALKMNVTEKSFVTNVKKLVQEYLFYDKSEYFKHKFE